jgi:N-acetylglucosaminyl-diphospho-decaprenol L-rhamnosyltransferase
VSLKPQIITASIVSHGHGPMLPSLLRQLLNFPEVGKIILTLNIPESIDIFDNRIQLLYNNAPKGFGANHNQAFSYCESEFFCVLNPDISFDVNPFLELLKSSSDSIGVVAPIVKNLDGVAEDSIRKFPSPISILCRRLFGYRDGYDSGKDSFYSEWVGGMCMLFPSSAYAAINGFDEQYFMYVEDADICTRLWLAGYKVLACPGAVVIHDARRASRKNWQHFRWHITSLLRYFWKYTGRLPTIP